MSTQTDSGRATEGAVVQAAVDLLGVKAKGCDTLLAALADHPERQYRTDAATAALEHIVDERGKPSFGGTVRTVDRSFAPADLIVRQPMVPRLYLSVKNMSKSGDSPEVLAVRTPKTERSPDLGQRLLGFQSLDTEAYCAVLEPVVQKLAEQGCTKWSKLGRGGVPVPPEVADQVKPRLYRDTTQLTIDFLERAKRPDALGGSRAATSLLTTIIGRYPHFRITTRPRGVVEVVSIDPDKVAATTYWTRRVSNSTFRVLFDAGWAFEFRIKTDGKLTSGLKYKVSSASRESTAHVRFQPPHAAPDHADRTTAYDNLKRMGGARAR